MLEVKELLYVDVYVVIINVLKIWLTSSTVEPLKMVLQKDSLIFVVENFKFTFDLVAVYKDS